MLYSKFVSILPVYFTAVSIIRQACFRCLLNGNPLYRTTSLGIQRRLIDEGQQIQWDQFPLQQKKPRYKSNIISGALDRKSSP
jgi:hypothetical protein